MEEGAAQVRAELAVEEVLELEGARALGRVAREERRVGWRSSSVSRMRVESAMTVPSSESTGTDFWPVIQKTNGMWKPGRSERRS